MKKVGIYFLSCIFILAGVIAGLFFYIKMELKPDVIKEAIVQNFNEKYPKLELSIEDVSYDIGAKISLSLEGMKLLKKSDKNDLIRFNNATLDTSVIDFFKSKGIITFKLNKPQIIIIKKDGEFELGSLFEPSFVNHQKVKQNKKETATKDIADLSTEDEVNQVISKKKVSLPRFILHSKLNLIINDLRVLLSQEQSTSEFVVDALKIKNIGPQSTAIYEITSSLKYSLGFHENESSPLAVDSVQNKKMKSERFLTSMVHLTGEFDIKKFLEAEAISTNIVTTMSNLSIPGVTKDLLNIKINANIESQDLKSINLFSRINSLNYFTSEFNLNVHLQEQLVTISNGFINFELSSLVKLLPIELAQNIDIQGRDTNILAFNTKTSFNFDFSNIKTNSSLSTSKEVTLKGIVPDSDIALKLNSSFSEQKADINFFIKLYQGDSNIRISSDYELDQLLNGAIPRLSALIKASGLKLKSKVLKDYLQKINSPNSKESQSELTGSLDQGKETVDDLKPHAPLFEPKLIKDLDISFDFQGLNFEIDDRPFEVAFELLVKESDMFLNGFSFKQNNQAFESFNFDGNLKHRGLLPLEAHSSLKFTQLDLSFFKTLLPFQVSEFKGTLNGKSKVAIKFDQFLKTQIESKGSLSAKSLEIDNLNIGLILDPYMNKDWMKKIIKSDKLKSTKGVFQEFSIDYSMNNAFLLKPVTFKFNSDNDLQGSLKGSLNLKAGTSTLIGWISSNEIRNNLKKDVGIEKLPLKLQGKTYLLKPDFAFTSSQLLKSAKKSQIKKIEKQLKSPQVKKKIQDKIKDALKNIKL